MSFIDDIVLNLKEKSMLCPLLHAMFYMFLYQILDNITCFLSLYSIQSDASTPSPDGSSFSDHDSECSRGTVPEKHTHEYREKELQELDNNDDMDISDNGQHHKTSNHVVAKSPPALDKLITIGCSNKRGSDTSPSSETFPGEPDVPSLPRKKIRDFEESLHMPEIGGYNMKDFMETTRRKRRIGLIREYERIKAEPPKGTFEASK